MHIIATFSLQGNIHAVVSLLEDSQACQALEDGKSAEEKCSLASDGEKTFWIFYIYLYIVNCFILFVFSPRVCDIKVY